MAVSRVVSRRRSRQSPGRHSRGDEGLAVILSAAKDLSSIPPHARRSRCPIFVVIPTEPQTTFPQRRGIPLRFPLSRHADKSPRRVPHSASLSGVGGFVEA